VETKVAVVTDVKCSDYRNTGNLSKQGEEGTWWRSWLRHCATGLKVVGSKALASTQSLTEMTTKGTSLGVKVTGE